MTRSSMPVRFTRCVVRFMAPALLLAVLAAPASSYTVRKDMSKLNEGIANPPGGFTPAAIETTIHHIVYSDDLEGSTAGWSVVNWRAGQPLGWNIVSSAQTCTGSAWWCGQTNVAPGRDGYANGWYQQLITNPPGGINIAGLNTARLTFKQRMRSEFIFDIGWILIKGGAAGTPWDTLATYSGDFGANCSNMTIDIPDSFKTVTQPITLQFLFGSDMSISAQDTTGAYTGWSLDDVKVAGTGGMQNDVRFFDDMSAGSTQWLASTPNPGSLWHLVSAPDPFSTCFFLSTSVYVPYAGNGLVPDGVDAMLATPPMDLTGVFSPNAATTSLQLEFDDWINLPSPNAVFWSLWISGSNDGTTWTSWKNVFGDLVMSGGNPQCLEADPTGQPPPPSNNLDFNPYDTSLTGVTPGTRFIRLGFRLRDEKPTTLTEDTAGALRLGVLTNGIWFDNVRVKHIYTITGVEPVSPAPVSARPALVRAYPNPFNPRTTLEFSVPESGPVTVRIYDTRGKTVATLVNGSMGPGVYRARWDGKSETGADASSGLYFAEIQGRAGRDTKRLTLLK